MSLKQILPCASAPLALIVMLGFVPMDALASSPSMPGHDATHPLVMQQAAREVAQASVGALQPFTAPPKMPAVGGGGGPQREVFGFALASSLSDPTLGYPSWNFSLLSTVAFFGLHVQDDGTFANDSGLSVWNSSQLTGLLATAHSHGTKVVLTIIEQDFSPGTPHMCSALAHANTTIAGTVAQLKAKGVDGVNLDYEGLNGSCGSSDSSGARHAFTSFAGEVRAALPAGSYFSVDTYASSAADAYGFFDIAALGHYVDSFFVMAYDLEYSNYSRMGCSSFCLGPTAPLSGYYYNDTSTVSHYTSVVPASQVILGVPYYGRKSCVASATPNAYPTSAVVADAYVDASGESTASSVKPGSFSAHRDSNDSAGLERWDTWVNTSLNCTRELYWDDAVSLAKKYDLVNRTNLRGVGIWNLNYGGGAPELWSTLNTYFECPVGITLAASETTTSFSLNLSSGGCAVTRFDVQQYDSTFNQGWFTVANAAALNGAATVVVDGYRGHTYQFQVRAHSTSGLIGPWSTATTAVSATATESHPWSGLYLLDGYGGVDAEDSPPLGVSGYWQGWKIARAAHARPGSNGQSGLVLDGWGGLHSYGSGITSFKGGGYWPNWDIARDFAWLPDGSGGYVLDGYGGLTGFSVNGAAIPAAQRGAPYFGWDIARKVVIFSDGTGGYVLDGWGGVHPFGIGQAAPPGPTLTDYWPHWDVARGIALVPGTHGGYVLDGYGGVHPLTPSGQTMPPVFKNETNWSWNIARGIYLLPSSTPAQPVGYVLDGWGGLHGLGPAPPIANPCYWPGWDIAVGVLGG